MYHGIPSFHSSHLDLLASCLAVCLVFQVNVGHPSEVDEIFDAISYSKGASVIRMLHNYIGDEVSSHTRTQKTHSHTHRVVHISIFTPSLSL